MSRSAFEAFEALPLHPTASRQATALRVIRLRRAASADVQTRASARRSLGEGGSEAS
jgi:hypothetical protein